MLGGVGGVGSVDVGQSLYDVVVEEFVISESNKLTFKAAKIVRLQDEQKWHVLDVSHVDEPNLKLRCVHSRTPKASENRPLSGTQIKTQVEKKIHIYWVGGHLTISSGRIRFLGGNAQMMPAKIVKGDYPNHDQRKGGCMSLVLTNGARS